MRIRSVQTPYRISTPFGKVLGYPLNDGFHIGVDYVSDNRAIVAPQNSVVVAIGTNSTSGNYLVLESNGYRDWFAHIKSYNVAQGQTVTQGQMLAIMGDTGYATGVHVHHSVRYNGKIVDAEKHIKDRIVIENTSAWKTRMSQVLREITGEKLTDTEFKSWVGAEPFSIVEALIDDKKRASQNDVTNLEEVTEKLYRRKK